MKNGDIRFQRRMKTVESEAELAEVQQGLTAGGGQFPSAAAGGTTGKPIQGNGYTMGGELDAEKKLAALPANLQVQVGKLPSKARNALMGMR